MGKKKIALHVVLDTNVVVSALLFADGRLSWLRQACREGTIVPLLSEATVHELMAVLAYPKFRLTANDIEVLLADYLPHGRSIHPVSAPTNAPRCRDSHDQMFIDLMLAGKADCLVTGDKDLLVLDGQLPGAVLTPVAFREYLEKTR